MMDIIHNFTIKTPAGNLYMALTSQQGINGWWARDADVGQRVGEVSKMRFAKESGTVEMHFRIDELKPGTRGRVSWTCIRNPNPAWLDTTIQFTIHESNEESSLTFTHGHWDSKWEGQINYEQTKEGWKHFMKSLKTYCETGKGEPW